MRVVITISNHVKQSAEKQAYRLGYPSLAALLKVTATLLAGQSMQQVEAVLTKPANVPSPPQLLGKLPHPEQFSVWPDHVTPIIATTDPDLYAFYIQIGLIR